jgi:hypothetical protein
MPIDAVNSAMNPLQFARARSASRAVETNAALSSNGGNGRSYGTAAAPQPAAPLPAHYSLPPAAFHWSYRLVRVNGKAVAKPTPQFADASLWSVAINRLG